MDGATKSRIARPERCAFRPLRGTPTPSARVIRIKNVPFNVVGVLDRKGQTTYGQDQDDIVIIPLSTAKKKVIGASQANARAVGSISVKVARRRDMIAGGRDEIRGLLRQRHRLQTYQDDDFWIRNLTEIAPVAGGLPSPGADAPAGRHRRPSRCWSAGSAS